MTMLTMTSNVSLIRVTDSNQTSSQVIFFARVGVGDGHLESMPTLSVRQILEKEYLLT